MSRYSVTPGESTNIQLNAADTVKSVLQAVAVILATPKGSVPTYREFGVEMSFLDLPLPVAEQRMRNEIREAVERWEPRATVKSVTFSYSEAESGKLIPTVEVEISGE